MKNHNQIYIALFLISLCSVSCQLLRHNKVPDSCIKKESLQVSLDIGVSEDSVWICTNEGNVMYHHSHKVHANSPLIISEKATFKCSALDVDYLGLPWVVDSEGSVHRLVNIASTSVKWVKIHEAKADNKALDVGCGQHVNNNCYISMVKGEILAFDGSKFIPSNFKSSKPLSSIDVLSNIDGESIVGIYVGENKAVEIRTGKERLLGIFGTDISVSYDNHIYISNGLGIYIKTRCSSGFYKLNDSIAKRIGAGNFMWFVALDDNIYKGKKLSSVQDCNN